MIINRTSPGINKPYEPIIWNDPGRYDYFYIDFQKNLGPFTRGMWQESVIVYGNALINTTNIEKISATVFKVYANISALPHGINVVHRKTTRLTLDSGEVLPVFSIHMFVAGQVYSIDGAYVYDGVAFSLDTSITENLEPLQLYSAVDAGSCYDSLSYSQLSTTCSDTTTIVIT